MKNYAIILASGSGNRFGGDLPKQFIKIKGKTILEYSILPFEETDKIDEIILVAAKGYENYANEIVKKAGYKKVSKIVTGGDIRKKSSYIGVLSVEDEEANVLIHDCARPFVSKRIINDCISALQNNLAVGVGIVPTDTIVEVKDGKIKSIPKRDDLRQIQTPQCFRLSLIKKAHEISENDSDFTDDCGLIIKYGLSEISVVDGDINNFKITYPNDIYLAEKIIEKGF